MDDPLPDYAARLDALHEALADDFRTILAQLPLTGGETVLDAGCGDGFFTGLLAERLATGRAIGLDSSPAFLRAARQRLQGHAAAGRAAVLEGDAMRLPFDTASVDAVVSVHSMQSYPDIPQALAEFQRVLKPGGLLAILESDNVHSIMLSWPPDLELLLRQAEHREIGSEDSYIGAYFPRFADRLLRAAAFGEISRQHALITRQAPASPPLQRYVELYLKSLLEHHGEKLSKTAAGRLEALADPASPRYLPLQADFFLGSLQTLITARQQDAA